MNAPVTDRLYQLLPAIHRIQDAQQGLPLRGLFAILEQELLALEADIDGLYDNWFIETCDEWVVHYIGDLLRIPRLHSGGIAGFSLRAYVANVLAYRRRKGTASVLEQMARDVSGWPARVVEFQQRMVWNQHVNNPRLGNSASINLRDSSSLQLLAGPFETANYSAEIRSVQCQRGRYNINNIGIFLWRLQSYALRGVEARHLDGAYFSFDSLGHEIPLYNRPQSETEISHLAEEINVPTPLRRRPLYEELNARRIAIDKGESPGSLYFGQQPVLQLILNGETLAAEQLMICNLSDRADLSNWQNSDIKVLVDPVLGLLAVPEAISTTDTRVDVDYAYGFSSDVGAGPYNRSESIIGLFADEDDLWWAGVSEQRAGEAGIYSSPAEAVQAWNESRGNRENKGVIAILDSATYNTPLTGAEFGIQLESNESLLMIAADWRGGRAPEVEAWRGELNLHLAADGLRPLFNGDIEVTAYADQDSAGQASGELYLNGLLVNGRLNVLAGDLSQLNLSHTTLVPQAGGLAVQSDPQESSRQNNGLRVNIHYCICGALQLTDALQSLQVSDSIIDAGVGPAHVAQAIGGLDQESFGPSTQLERCSIFDDVRVRELVLASETLFMGDVEVQRQQTGCVRYSYLKLSSRVPRRFRCQPDLALEARARDLFFDSVEQLDQQEIRRVSLRLRPQFNSNTFGDPGYAQLQPRCATEISNGAEEGTEMGVFNHLKQPQREANIRASLDEYLRFGMNAGLIFVSDPDNLSDEMAQDLVRNIANKQSIQTIQNGSSQ